MRNLNQFIEDSCPSLQDQSATVWRGFVDPQRSVAVIQYAGEETFVARAMFFDASVSRGITTRQHRTRLIAAREALRLSQILYMHVSSKSNSI